jgi:hypothetical protein
VKKQAGQPSQGKIVRGKMEKGFEKVILKRDVICE